MTALPTLFFVSTAVLTTAVQTSDVFFLIASPVLESADFTESRKDAIEKNDYEPQAAFGTTTVVDLDERGRLADVIDALALMRSVSASYCLSAASN